MSCFILSSNPKLLLIMRKITTLFSFFILMLFATAAMAQSTLTGIVADNPTGETLPGATVVVAGTTNGTITDVNGKFSLSIASGETKIKISYVGYLVKEVAISVDGNTDAGIISLYPDAVGIEEINVIASVAIDRQTPVAVSSIKTETIENKLGSQEFPEILKTTPGVYATKQGGGYGDARINIRGFNQRNIAVMINGIPVNDMENGWVYWSNWSGLSDVTRTMQVQRGLGASKLAISSVGGTMNIITKQSEQKKGITYKSTYGNNGYFKNALTLSTGELSTGTAVTFSGSRTVGNGYVNGTWIDAWSYFLSITQKISENQRLVLTGIGAPQQHGQRSYQTKFATFQDKGLIYNDQVGLDKDGEEFTLRRNFYHKPQFALNHYWNVTEKTFLATSAYASYGRGGGTGDYGRIAGDKYYKFYNAEGYIDVANFQNYNTGAAAFESDGTPITNMPDADGKYAAGIIQRASMNEHNWYGVLSTLTHELTESVNLIAGIDVRSYKGLHYRKVTDLLGADYYFEPGYIDDNRPDGYKAVVGDKVGYDNDGYNRWGGLFTQIEYSKDALSLFTALSGAMNQYMRVDRFNYTTAEDQKSEWQTFSGFNVKGGANYNLNETMNVYVNSGYFSRAPKFADVFVNYSNDLATEINNEKVFSFEAGYGLRSKLLSANINVYNTQWMDKSFQMRYNDANGDTKYANITGQNALHRGVELDLISNPVKGLSITGMASIGDWTWKNNAEGKIFDDNNTLLSEITLYADGLKVGDAAQTGMALGARYKFDFGLSFDADFILYDRLYANYDPEDRTNPDETSQPLEVPSYSLIDAGVSYSFKVKNVGMMLRANVNNLLDTEYISEATDFIRYDDNNIKIEDINQGKGFYGMGRTFNVSLRIKL